MSNYFSILIFPKTNRPDKDGNCTLYCRVTVDGRRAAFSLQRKVHPNDWNGTSNRVKGSKPSVKQLNRFLDEVRARLLKIQGEYVRKGTYYTVEMLRNAFLGLDKQQHTVLKLYEEHNQEIAVMVGQEYSSGAYLRHVRTRKRLVAFIKKEYRMEDMPLREVDLKFIKRFEHYLKTLNIGNRNTITKYVVNFKKIMRIAYAHDWITKDPFFHWKAEWQVVEREALNERELNRLIEKEFPIERLEHVKNLFLFSCFTGLSYSDVKELTANDIVKNMNGEQIIKIKRAKTSVMSCVPLLPPAKSILKKYRTFKKTNERQLVLPVISNQKMNAYLKEIADICKIRKKLTFHLARHTFATTVTLANGVPIESVSRMLGHRSLRTTQIYAKVLDKKLVEDMIQVKDKFQKIG